MDPSSDEKLDTSMASKAQPIDELILFYFLALLTNLDQQGYSIEGIANRRLLAFYSSLLR